MCILSKYIHIRRLIMKKLSAIILSIAMCSAVGAMPAKAQATVYETNNRKSTCYVYDCLEAVGFHSWEDYLNGGEYTYKLFGTAYMGGYDYIYMPAAFADCTDDITDMLIAPNYIEITYEIDGKTYKTCHYYVSDGCDSCKAEPQFELKAGERRVVNGTKIYTVAKKQYFVYNDSYFEMSENVPLSDEGELMVKKFTDPHLSENNGELYYTEDDGSAGVGWKDVNGHKYYFKPSGKAVKGKAMKIDGYYYNFSANGVCMGKFTGYIRTSDGKKIHCTDGIADKT